MEITADPGLTLVAFSADPQSPDSDALQLLASWAATQQSETSPPDLRSGRN